MRHTDHPILIFAISPNFLAKATGKDKNAICMPCTVFLRDLTETPGFSRTDSTAFWTSSIVASSSKSLMTTSAVSASDLTAARSPKALPTASSTSLVLWTRALLRRSSSSPFAVLRMAWTGAEGKDHLVPTLVDRHMNILCQSV